MLKWKKVLKIEISEDDFCGVVSFKFEINIFHVITNEFNLAFVAHDFTV